MNRRLQRRKPGFVLGSGPQVEETQLSSYSGPGSPVASREQVTQRKIISHGGQGVRVTISVVVSTDWVALGSAMALLVWFHSFSGPEAETN